MKLPKGPRMEHGNTTDGICLVGQPFFWLNLFSPSLTWKLRMMGFQVRNLLFLLVPFSGEPC